MDKENIRPGDTPVKLYVGCFTCSDRYSTRNYKIHGSKCANDNTIYKLESIIGFTIECSDDTIICRPCLNRINNSYDFQQSATKSVQSYSSNFTTKRCHKSPITPKPLSTLSQASQAVNLQSEDLSFHPKDCSTPIKSKKRVCKNLQESTICLPPNIIPLPVTPKLHDVSGISKLNDSSINEESITTTDHNYVPQLKRTPSESRNKCELPVDILRRRGIQWNPDYKLDTGLQCPSNVLKQLCDSDSFDTTKFGKIVKNCPELYNCIKREILLDLNCDVSALSSRTVPFQSVMLKHRNINDLQNTDEFLNGLLHEMNERCPFLLDVLMTTMTGHFKTPQSSMFGPIIAVYGILMHQRDQHLSAFQRLLTMLCVKGNANDDFIRRLNKFGISLGATSKLVVLDGCADVSDKNIVKALQVQPLVKVTGDNLDILIRTQHQASDHGHQDLHMFTSNMIFNRIPMRNVPDESPIVNLQDLTPEQFMLSEMEKDHLLQSYVVLVGRILSEHLPAFRWMSTILPDHIPHTYTDQMSQKSQVHPLPIVMKNEAKYEECVDILDSYEDELIKLFTEAHGDTSELDEHGVVLGGDQLTRVRLQGAKGLRYLAPEARKRFEHLFPIVCEMWHNKQDLLHKAYKTLYRRESPPTRGTLYFFKSLLRRTDVNGNVKSNFKAHWDLLTSVGTFLIVEQAVEYFGMADHNSLPTMNNPPDLSNASRVEKLQTATRLLRKFLAHYKYGDFSLTQDPQPQTQPQPTEQEQFIVIGETAKGIKVLMKVQPSKSEAKPSKKEENTDSLFNYSSNLCHWALHLMQLDDTAKEGDTDRVILNCKYNLGFFFSHSKLSKYFIENIDYILKTQFILSPRMRLRVLDTTFVNVKGGVGNNVEADLVQEHSVRNRKDLIRNLGANKTAQAILRVTNAADAVATICHQVDNTLNLRTTGARHTKRTSLEDCTKIKRVLRVQRPFQKDQAGRQCNGFNTIGESPFDKIDKEQMRTFLKRNILRLGRGQAVETEQDDEEDGDDDDGIPDMA